MSHQRSEGSFGGLFDTNAVLPLLAGRTLLGVADQPCLMRPQNADSEVVWQGGWWGRRCVVLWWVGAALC